MLSRDQMNKNLFLYYSTIENPVHSKKIMFELFKKAII